MVAIMICSSHGNPDATQEFIKDINNCFSQTDINEQVWESNGKIWYSNNRKFPKEKAIQYCICIFFALGAAYIHELTLKDTES